MWNGHSPHQFGYPVKEESIQSNPDSSKHFKTQICKDLQKSIEFKNL
jgi:hypothetical protein